jgi:hypothetical protein
MAKVEGSSGNVILDHPGVAAAVFALVTLFVFVGALYNVATSSHHPSSHGGGHPAAPAGAAQH